MPTLAERVQALEDWKVVVTQEIRDLRDKLQEARDAEGNALQLLREQSEKREQHLKREIRRIERRG